MARFLSTVLFAALLRTTHAGAGVLSATPPMGFNDWSQYMGALDQQLFMDTAQAMVNKGFLQAGYNRINLDDEWSTMERLANGSMMWNEDKFPEGLRWLTSQLKSMGFMPGIYTDAGQKSCGGFPGAFGHEQLDAETFAGWGFEYLKLDGCNMPVSTEAEYRDVYGKWHTILSGLENPLVFSESAPAYFAEADNLTDWYTVMSWVPQFGQLARHSRDTLVWNSTSYWPDITGWDSVMFNYGQEVRLARFQRPGYVNDPDFLNVDHFDYTLDERRSHFALWASFSAPLILSTNMLNITDDEVAYLTNRDIIAIDQDPLVQQATLVSQGPQWDVLTKSLYNGDRLLTVLNKGNDIGSMVVPWSHIGLSPGELATPQMLTVKDLWTGDITTVATHTDGIHATSVPRHGTALFRISNPSTGDAVRVIPTGMIFNTYSLSCLTDAGHLGGIVEWANCTGSDAQVWRVRSDGTVSSLRNSNTCLLEERGALRTGYCFGPSVVWDYFVSGNLVSRSTGNCLTQPESKTGPAVTERCGYMTNEQVVALPVGVVV